MSEKIFVYEKIATNAVLVMLIFIVLFFIVPIIKTIIVRHITKKKERQERILSVANKIVDKNVDHIIKIQNNSDDEKFKESLLSEIRNNQNKNEDVQYEGEKIITKLDEKIKRAKKLDYVRLFFAVIMIGALTVIISLAPRLSGKVSLLNKLDYENQELKINAYYTVSYSGTDQVTLTLYVKNNSTKSLRSASIVQKETGSTAKITNLDSGEEKIVSLNSYKGDKYEFEIQDIVFNE